jgi:hypothetical protein
MSGWTVPTTSPKRGEVLPDYLRAVSELSISDVDKEVLQKKVSDLTQSAEDAEQKMSKLDPAVIDKLIADQKELKRLMSTVLKIHLDDKTIVDVSLSGDPHDPSKTVKKFVRESPEGQEV